MDVTIHNALLDKTPELVNIGIENGQIVKITTDALSSGEQSIDALGRLVIRRSLSPIFTWTIRSSGVITKRTI